MKTNSLLIGFALLTSTSLCYAANDYMNPSAEFLHLKNFSQQTTRVTEDEISRMRGLPIEPYPSKSKKFWYNLFHNQLLNSSAPFGMQEMDLTQHPRETELKDYRRWKDPYPGYNQNGEITPTKKFPAYNKY